MAYGSIHGAELPAAVNSSQVLNLITGKSNDFFQDVSGEKLLKGSTSQLSGNPTAGMAGVPLPKR